MKILTLNLKASDKNYSQVQRMEPVIELANKENIDVFLLQEGTYGLFTGNSINKLKNLVNPNFDMVQHQCFGYYLFYQFQLGIISRYSFQYALSSSCRVKSQFTSVCDWMPMPDRKRALAQFIRVEDKNYWIVTLHLNSSPIDEQADQDQLVLLCNFLNGLYADAVIVGGDFNDPLTRINKFLNPMRYELVINSGSDAVFVKGCDAISAKVVFDNSIVSDHKGLLVEI